ncbi:MAG: hypothetical protein JWO89_3444, partial [Verrucomicrobiaceae bacterium]|nr:hypothetical protein [Verrucomicrobiaceae bacterium]
MFFMKLATTALFAEGANLLLHRLRLRNR